MHPQSIVHSMVEFEDGSVLAQLGNPDMKTPIAHAMAWPRRIESGTERLDFFQMTDLHEAPISTGFPVCASPSRRRAGGEAVRCSTQLTKKQWPRFG